MIYEAVTPECGKSVVQVLVVRDWFVVQVLVIRVDIGGHCSGSGYQC